MTRSPVSDTVTFEFSDPVAVGEVRIGPGGEVQMLSAGKMLSPKYASRGQHRDRANGREKPLYSIPVTTAPVLKRAEDLLVQFRFVFTIDTNTIIVDGDHVSFASIAVSTVVPSPQGGHATMFTAHPGGFEFHGLAANQERLAWALLQDAIIGSPDFNPQAKYLMVTDHAKGMHAAINGRQESIFGEILLAPSLTLGFATSDSGSSLVQRIIRSCDRHAGRFLKDVRDGQINQKNYRKLSAGPITAFRGVTNTRWSWPAKAGPPFRLSTATPLLDTFELG